MKLIKMDGLIDDLTTAVAHDELSGREFSIVKRYIMRQDAVDAVEVVRCKDCKYHDKKLLFAYDHRDEYAYYCLKDEYPRAVNKYGFCNYGEREEPWD
jgi:hypothetical protein